MNKIIVEVNGESFRLVKGHSNELACSKCAMYNICLTVGQYCVDVANDTKNPYGYYFVSD